MSTALAKTEPQELAAITPMQLLHAAVSQGAQIDTIERLAKLQEQMMNRDAEKEFNLALHNVQSEARRIGTDKKNSQTGSKYATFTKMDAALRPIYSKHGFSLSFNTADGRSLDSVKVIAYLSHIGGHTREYSVDMPADGKGAKGNDVMTRTHATGSAISYGKRYLEGSIFNVTVGDTDDDGNGADSKVVYAPEDEMVGFIGDINGCSSVEETVKVFQLAYKYVSENYGDKNALAELQDAKNKRKTELQKAGA